MRADMPATTHGMVLAYLARSFDTAVKETQKCHKSCNQSSSGASASVCAYQQDNNERGSCCSRRACNTARG
eukprot:6203993-Pleurochrysis_carterae.AAC.4